MSTRVAVIGDVHGNARALRATLETATRVGFDQLVFMGDLLNYGVDTREVVDLVAEAQANYAAPILRGNHDDLVIALLNESRRTGYYDTLPAWIRESVDLTISDLDAKSFRALVFASSTVVAGSYFAHANPFAEGDYRYLNSHDDHVAAASALQGLGHRIGVFGHTHRVRAFAARPDRAGFEPLGGSLKVALDQAATWVVNAGSIGQPREAPPVCRFLVLDTGPDHHLAEAVDVPWDRDAHVAALHRAPLSAPTRERLVAFFREPS